MAILLGGRAAERLIFDELSTGAADDLAKATDIARAMAARYGMVEQLGQITYDREQPTFLGGPPMPHPREFSESTAREIDCAVRELVEDAYQQALAVLRQRRATLEKGAALLRHQTMSEAELKALVAEPAAAS